MKALFTAPLKTIGFTILILFVAYYLAGVFPYRNIETVTHGAQAHATPTDPLTMKGQEVYIQEGCVYCHTQNIRPMEWEVNNFVDVEAYGHAPLQEFMEYYYDNPSVRGSRRLGPDLARLAGNMSEDEVRNLLRSRGTDSAREAYHTYGYLFADYSMAPVLMSWKLRAMRNQGIPISDAFQRSSFDRLEGQSRGDALVSYLMSLGKRQKEFAGQYYGGN